MHRCLIGFVAVACAVACEPTARHAPIYTFAVNAKAVDRHGVPGSHAGPLVDICSFVTGDHVVLADVMREPANVAGCADGVAAALRHHHAVPLRVDTVLAGGPLPTEFIAAVRGNDQQGVPRLGERVVVSVVSDGGDYLVSDLVYVRTPESRADRVVVPGAVSLPATRDALKAAIAAAHLAPESACTPSVLAAKIPRAQLVAHYRRHESDPCSAGILQDDGMPTPSPR